MITNLLFDMDNTLYPETSLLEKNMTIRIISFVSEFLNISIERATNARLDGLTRYGTTLEWLMTEHGFSKTTEYFAYIHPDIEKNEVEFDANLRPFLEELSNKYHLSVLTNAPKIHADCILNRLEVYDLFDGVYDLDDMSFLGKPHKKAYLKAVQEKGYSIEETLFFDDTPKCIKGFSDLGGKGILVDQIGRHSKALIEEINAFAVIQSVYEIPQLLEQYKL